MDESAENSPPSEFGGREDEMDYYPDPSMSPLPAGFPENWKGSKRLTSEMRFPGSTGLPATSSPCRFSISSGTALPPATSSSPDTRRHHAQVENRIENHAEYEKVAPPSFNNNYPDLDMSPRAPVCLKNGDRAGDSLRDDSSSSEESMSGKRFSGGMPRGTGLSATSSPRGVRRSFSNSLDTAPPTSISGTLSYSDTAPKLVPQVDDCDAFIENYTESEPVAPPILERYPPSPDAAKENDVEARLEKKRARDRINQKIYYYKKKKTATRHVKKSRD